MFIFDNPSVIFIYQGWTIHQEWYLPTFANNPNLLPNNGSEQIIQWTIHTVCSMFTLLDVAYPMKQSTVCTQENWIFAHELYCCVHVCMHTKSSSYKNSSQLIIVYVVRSMFRLKMKFIHCFIEKCYSVTRHISGWIDL